MTHKYSARAVTIDGIRFASQAEGKRYAQLKLMQQAGEITGLQLQPQWLFELNGVRIGSYKADFAYRDFAAGPLVVEDVKSAGTITTAYRLRVRMLYAFYEQIVWEVDAKGNRKIAYEPPKRPRTRRQAVNEAVMAKMNLGART